MGLECTELGSVVHEEAGGGRTRPTRVLVFILRALGSLEGL